MTVNYLWNCTRVDAYPVENEHQDVVYNVHWSLLGASNENTMPNGQPYQASTVGTQELGSPGIGNFTPFESLTNVVVTDWVKIAMGPEAVEAIELDLTNQISGLINPTSLSLIIGQQIPN